MNVAYVCADPGVPIFGSKGCSVHAQEILNTLRDFGHSVQLFAQNPGKLIGNEISFHQLPFISRGNRSDRERELFRMNKQIPLMLRDAGPFDLLYERHSLWSYGAMEYSRAAGIPSVLEVNAPLVEDQQNYRELIHVRRAEFVARRAFENATCVAVVSREITKYIKRYARRIDHVQVVPNGVSPLRFPRGLASAIPRQNGTLTIGFLGSLKPWHGLPVLAEAFYLLSMRYPTARLLIVGDGPERADLESRLARWNLLHRTHFTGAVSPKEVPGLLRSMDIAVAPYRDIAHHYFSPLKLFEYMAAGLPIVADNIGQISEIIEDEKNGLLVKSGNVRELAGSVERLLINPALRERLGMAARSTVLRNHTWRGRIERILNFILVKRKKLPEREVKKPAMYEPARWKRSHIAAIPRQI
ncbi:MAG TPA: glycosyltransferase family 4 protein [Acidobacteriota bacterium]